MIEPLTILGQLSGTITATVAISTLLIGLHNTPSEALSCLTLVSLLHNDLQHCALLRNKHRALLSSRPLDVKRIDDILASATRSLANIAPLVERLRADVQGGKVPYQRRFRWVLGDKESFALRTRELGAQHAVVGGEIGWLRLLEMYEAGAGKDGAGGPSIDNLDLWKSKEKDFENYDDEFNPQPPSHLSPPVVQVPLQRVPSSETLVGSVRDVRELQLEPYETSWFQEAPNKAMGGCDFPEVVPAEVTRRLPWESETNFPEVVPATTTPGPPWALETYLPKAISTVTTSQLQWSSETYPETVGSFKDSEPEDELGQFFRQWKEDQEEQKRMSAY